MQEVGARVRELLGKRSAPQTQADLAREVGMTPDALSRSISGQRAFALDEVVRLASALSTSVHWLATGTEDPFSMAVAARHGYDHDARTHATVDWQRVRGHLDDVALAYEQADDALPFSPRASVTGLTAAEVRHRLEEASGPHFVRCFAEAIQKVFDVDVVRVGGVGDGYSLQVGRHKAIVISDTSNWFFQNWSLAHELGHMAKGSVEGIDQPDRDVSSRERAANSFAGELLLPAEWLRTFDWQTMSGAELAELVWECGASTKSLATRLRVLGIQPSTDVSALLADSTQKLLRGHVRWRRDGVDHVTLRMQAASTRAFPTRLVTAHREKVAKGALPPLTLAWMLGDDAESLREELAPASTNDVDELERLLSRGDQ